MSGFRQVNTLCPCELCRGTTDCRTSDDGAYFCRRAPKWDHDGYHYFRDDKWGFGIFRPAGEYRDGRHYFAPRPPTLTIAPGLATQPRPADATRTDWASFHAALPEQDYHHEHRQILALALGVPEQALDRVHYSFAPRDGWDLYATQWKVANADYWRSCWVAPMRDATGQIVGTHRRFPDGTKKTAKQQPGDPSADGLYYADDWREGTGPVWIVEGPSDVAAMLAMGCRAVGRPNNLAGGRHLALLLGGLPVGTEVIVVGENDGRCRESDGKWIWPGKEGAEKVSREIADACPHLSVYWCLPPAGSKDVREWARAREGNWSAERGQEWERAVRAAGMVAVLPRPGFPVHPSPAVFPGTERDLIYGEETEEEDHRLSRAREDAAEEQAPCVASCLPAFCRETPPRCLCPFRKSIICKHKHRPDTATVRGLSCGCWKCVIDRKINSSQEAVHLAWVMTQAMAVGLTIYCVTYTQARRRAVKDRRRKLGISHWKELMRSDGSFLLFFAADADIAFPGAERLAADGAAADIAMWKEEVDEHGFPPGHKRLRVVNSSDSWRLPDPPRTDNWDVIAASSVRDEAQVVAELAKAGITHYWVVDWPDIGASSVLPPFTFDVQFRCDEERLKRLIANLDCHDDPTTGGP